MKQLHQQDLRSPSITQTHQRLNPLLGSERIRERSGRAELTERCEFPLVSPPLADPLSHSLCIFHSVMLCEFRNRGLGDLRGRERQRAGVHGCLRAGRALCQIQGLQNTSGREPGWAAALCLPSLHVFHTLHTSASHSR